MVSAEDPTASRTARLSPVHQRNGHGDRDRSGSASRTEERRGSTRQTHPEHLNTGPAFRASSRGSIPYIDCRDLDFEYSLGRDQAAFRVNHSQRDQALLRRGSGTGSINGPLQVQQEHFLGRMQYRESPSSSRQSLNMSPEFNKSQQKINQSPAHSIKLDPAHFRERHCSSPLTVQHGPSRSVVTSPVLDPLHQPNSVRYSEQNGFGSAPPPHEEGRYSPLPSRSPRLNKPHKVRYRADINTNQGASSGQESRPVLSRAERMAALERRMVVNGLSAPGRPRSSLGQKRLGPPGSPHMGGVQMNDCSTTSGSESSESEVESNKGNSSTVVFGNQTEAKSSSPIPRNKFSFGSLQLDEEADEDACQAFSDEDGAQIFSC